MAHIKSVSAGAVSDRIAPSEQIVKSSKKEFTGVDALGRTITLRKPSAWEQFKLAGYMSAKDAMNQALAFQWAMMQYVVRIGEDFDVFFTNERELKAIIDTLGEEGMEAVQSIFMDNFIPTAEEGNSELKK